MGKFDVFISFKNTDSDGKFTRDREMAEKLFVALKEKNINAFYSNVSIAERGESHFGKMINEALDECDIFVAVGSSVEYLQSQWVKYEIETFNNELLNGNKTLEKSAMYSYVTTDVRTNKLPMELRRCQSFTDLDAIVSSICKRINNQQEVKQAFAVPQDVNAPRKIQIGSIVDGKYEVIKQIGRGGMCTVYLAINKSANKHWAIKVVEDDGRGMFKTKISSFMFEVNLLRELDSPYFPRVVDVIQESESYIIVMDYIEGDSLENILNECGSQPEKMVKEWAKELCYALQTLHTRRPAIIYRDMKPANIMITPFGGVKIIDFGAAREYKPETVSNMGDTTVLGTVGYAAPEQYGGLGQTDARTDIYGLGVTLYHALTNRNPSDPPYEILPVREINPEISCAMEYIVKKCTNRDPSKRYQKVEEIIEDLENMDVLEKKLKKSKSKLFSGIGAKKEQKATPKLKYDVFAPASNVPTAPTPVKPVPKNEFKIPGTPPMMPNVQKGNTIPVSKPKVDTPVVPPISSIPLEFSDDFELLPNTFTPTYISNRPTKETQLLKNNGTKTQRGDTVKAYLIVAGMNDFSRSESAQIRFYLVTEKNKNDVKKSMLLSPEYSNFVKTNQFEIGLKENVVVKIMSCGLYLDKHEARLSCNLPYDHAIALKSPHESAGGAYSSAIFYVQCGSQIEASLEMSFGLQ